MNAFASRRPQLTGHVLAVGSIQRHFFGASTAFLLAFYASLVVFMTIATFHSIESKGGQVRITLSQRFRISVSFCTLDMVAGLVRHLMKWRAVKLSLLTKVVCLLTIQAFVAANFVHLFIFFSCKWAYIPEQSRTLEQLLHSVPWSIFTSIPWSAGRRHPIS
jgi:hypothetical protein